MKYKLLYFLLSLIVIIPGGVSLISFGLKPAVDFTGGSLWELNIAASRPITDTDIKDALGDKASAVSSIQLSGESWVIRAKPLSEPEHQQLKQAFQEKLGPVTDIRFDSVGPTLGQELLKKTITAVALASVFILLLIAWRFKNLKFGLAAIIAMFHDTLILLGAFSLLGRFFAIEVDTLFVTAMLTILSFSVHDTIVVFDRIRETSRLNLKVEFEAIVNQAVAETLSRSVNNSMTIIFMLLSLFLLGGPTIKYFVLALLVGTISGTYSSTFTAAPLLVIFNQLKIRK